MNFKLDEDLLEKITNILDHIGKILNIDLDYYFYDDNNGITYFILLHEETCFRKDKDKTTNTIPDEKTKYNCRVLLKIQSVYYNNIEDTNYYPQLFLESCRYKFLANNRLIHDVLDSTDTEPEIESKEEFNEDTE